jgi:hypothetical protein
MQNAGESKMTYLLTWGMGPKEVMSPGCKVGEEMHPLVVASSSPLMLSDSTFLYQNSS